MKRIKNTLTLGIGSMVLVLASGCSTIATEGAQRVSLFRDDGNSPSAEVLKRVQNKDYQEGLIFEIKAGDVIHVNVEQSGEIFRILESEPMKLEFTQDIFAYVNEKGIHASLDGIKFKPIDDFVNGSLAVAFSMQQQDRKNQLTFQLKVRTKE